MFTRHATAALTIVAALSLTACGDVDLADTESRPVERTDDAATDGVATDGAANDDGEDADVPPATGGEPQDQELAVDLRHPDGLRVEVSALRFDGDTIELDTRISNDLAYTVGIHLDCGQAPASSVLQDDLDNVYRVAYQGEEGEDCSVQLEPDAVLSGTLAFRGPIVPEATELSWFVYTLPGHREDAEHGVVTLNYGAPGWRVDLPLERG